MSGSRGMRLSAATDVASADGTVGDACRHSNHSSHAATDCTQSDNVLELGLQGESGAQTEMVIEEVERLREWHASMMFYPGKAGFVAGMVYCCSMFAL